MQGKQGTTSIRVRYILLGYVVLGVCTYIGMGAFFQNVAKANLPEQAQLPLTREEQLALANLQWRKRAMDAEYGRALAELSNDAKEYAGAVTASHKDMPYIFDLRTLSWVRKVAPPEDKK